MNLSFLDKIKTNKDRNLLEISNKQPVLILFLRHFGCIFCRESLKEISKKLDDFKKKNIHLVFFHMTDNATADEYFDEYGLQGVEHVADPNTNIYEKFGLAKGNFKQLFGLKNWIRGFDAMSKGNSVTTKQIGDGFQMPGVFLIYKGNLEESYIHEYASDKPDYDNIIKCCVDDTPA